MPVAANTYNFLISDENEVMLIMYARDLAPEQSAAHLNPEQKSIELYRRVDDAFTLENVEPEVFEILQNHDSLLVCEILPAENSDETEIVYAYKAVLL